MSNIALSSIGAFVVEVKPPNNEKEVFPVSFWYEKGLKRWRCNWTDYCHDGGFTILPENKEEVVVMLNESRFAENAENYPDGTIITILPHSSPKWDTLTIAGDYRLLDGDGVSYFEVVE